jgi:hypothetical protein
MNTLRRLLTVSCSFPMISRSRCNASSALPFRHRITRSSGGVSQRHANMSAEQFVFPALSVRGGYGGPDRSSVTRGRL